MTEKTKILVSYFFGPTSIPLGESCARALEGLGYKVGRFDSGARGPIYSSLLKPLGKLIRALSLRRLDLFKDTAHRFRERALEKSVASFRPEILFVIRGHGFDVGFLQHLKRKYGVKKLVGWWVKGPKWFDLMKSEADAFDAYFCIHQEGYTKQDHINYLPALGVDTVLYHPGSGPQQFKHEAIFVGSWNPRRQAIIEQLGDVPLEIYGPGWLQKNLLNPAVRSKIRGQGIWGEALTQLYRTSKIVLNISAWEPAATTAFNLRLIDVPATGAFLLTDETEGLQQYLQSGKEVATFANALELKEKLLHYLSHDLERDTIARSGNKKVSSFESYQDKMLTLLAALDEHVKYNPDPS